MYAETIGVFVVYSLYILSVHTVYTVHTQQYILTLYTVYERFSFSGSFNFSVQRIELKFKNDYHTLLYYSFLLYYDIIVCIYTGREQQKR